MLVLIKMEFYQLVRNRLFYLMAGISIIFGALMVRDILEIQIPLVSRWQMDYLYLEEWSMILPCGSLSLGR